MLEFFTPENSDAFLAIFDAIASFIGGERANSANKKMAREQMDFQERMAKNSHQYEVEDLRAAGLNPILSAKLGGAATPSGASATMMDTISPAVSSARAAQRLKAEISNMEETNANLREQNKKIQSDTVLNKALETSAKADAHLKATTAKNVAINTALNATNLPAAKTKEAIDDSKAGSIITGLKHILGGSGASPASALSTLVTKGRGLMPGR